MVVAALHLGRSGYGRWGGRVTSVITYLACWYSLCRTRSSAPRSWVASGVRRSPDCIGRSWPRAGERCDAQIANFRGTAPVHDRLPGEPCRGWLFRRSPYCSSRQHTSPCIGNQPSWHVRQGQQSSDWSGFGSEREDRNIATTGISLFRLFSQFPSRPPHFSLCLSCMTCWSQLSSRPQRLSPIFSPDPAGHSSRRKKTGACPSPLRFAFGVARPWPAAR
jgi:hypothetical protein